MCNCKVCERNRVIQSHLEKLPEPHQQFFTLLYDDLMEAEMDRDYYEAIVRNEWPDADKILERFRLPK